MPYRRNHKQGFTLMEMLIVTVLAAVVSLAIYSTLSQGIKIWQRLSRSLPDEDTGIFSERFVRDLNNTINFSQIKFTGNKTEFSFAGLVTGQSLQPGLKRNVGEVKYSFDKDKGAVMRVQRDYSQVYTDKQVPQQVVLGGVKSLNFQYYFYDKLEEAYVWQPDWVEEGLPKAVKVELQLDYGDQIRQFERTVSVPVGG